MQFQISSNQMQFQISSNQFQISTMFLVPIANKILILNYINEILNGSPICTKGYKHGLF